MKLKYMLYLLTYLIVFTSPVSSSQPPITDFSLANYDQNIDHFVKPSDYDYDMPLIDFETQKKRLREYYNHYYATDDNSLSPWGRKYVEVTLNDKLKDVISESKIIDKYDNSVNRADPMKLGYGANLILHSDLWLKSIINNMNLEQFQFPIKCDPNKRGIAIKNLNARLLPTMDPFFHHFSLPGQGYPFDNLQNSSLWVGTPVYIVGETRDKQWFLVLTPEYISWVQSDGIAKVDNNFIIRWQKYAAQEMIAITSTNVSIFNKITKQYQFNAYVGTVFPGKNIDNINALTILIPISDFNHNAKISFAEISNEDAVVMPFPATPHNFANIIRRLTGRPYGWGNMYFYNDCSSELKSLYTPFGIWLPRNSLDQSTCGNIVDKSSANPKERLDYLEENGKKFTTIVYIGGHVFLYIGNYPNQNNSSGDPILMSYQNMWGLSPTDRSYRAVIGGSVLFPVLLEYPEDYKLVSLAGKKYFQISYLDTAPK